MYCNYEIITQIKPKDFSSHIGYKDMQWDELIVFPCPLSYVDIKDTPFSKDASLPAQNIYKDIHMGTPTYMHVRSCARVCVCAHTHMKKHGIQSTKKPRVPRKRFGLRKRGRSGTYLALRSIYMMVGKCGLQQICHSIMTVHNGSHNDSVILLTLRREVIK